MAKIRKKFKESGAKLSGYDRRKYVSKILYMYLLGYEPDFGYMEAINLISSSKYAEKQMVIIDLKLQPDVSQTTARLNIPTRAMSHWE